MVDLVRLLNDSTVDNCYLLWLSCTQLYLHLYWPLSFTIFVIALVLHYYDVRVAPKNNNIASFQISKVEPNTKLIVTCKHLLSRAFGPLYVITFSLGTQLLAIIFILFLLLPLLSGSHQRQIFNLGFVFFCHCLRTHLFSTSLVRLVILAHFSSSSVHLLMWSLLEDSLT